MPYRHALSLIIACLALAACTTDQKNTTSSALDTVGAETSASFNKLRDYADVGSKPKPPPPSNVQPRYCYTTMQDIICYGQPLPGQEERLVGYQTQSGKTGYTLPTHIVSQDTPLPPLKSVNVPSPPPVKGDNTQLKEIIFDPAELEPKELVPDKQE